MDIQYVPNGEIAPENAHKITIHLTEWQGGIYGIGFNRVGHNHFVHANDFDTPEQAEQAALKRAEERGAKLIHVERPDA